MEEAKEHGPNLKKVSYLIEELVNTEASHIAMVGLAHEHLEPYLADPRVETRDKRLLQAYLRQWDTLKTLYDQLPFDLLSNSEQSLTQNFVNFCSTPAFITYQKMHIGMFPWVRQINTLYEKYSSINLKNEDLQQKLRFDAVVIAAAQRLPRHELLMKDVKKADESMNTSIIIKIKKLNTFINELSPNNTSWTDHTNEVWLEILNGVSSSNLSDQDKIKAYHSMIVMIDGGLFGNENPVEKLAAIRTYAERAFELIKTQFPLASTMTEIVQLTSILKDIRDLAQTPAGTDKAAKRFFGGESTSNSKTIQKQLREYFTDTPMILHHATEIMQSSSESIVEKSTMARALLDLVLEPGKSISGVQLSSARLLAKAALDDAVEEYKARGVMDEHMHDAMTKINEAVASPVVERFFKRVTGNTESDGVNKSIQKCLREFVHDPAAYIASLSPQTSSPASEASA